MKLADLTLSQAADLLSRREVSPVDLTQASLDRVTVLEPKLNAFITLTADSALEDARRAADEIARGEYRGPLHGIPFGIKDMFNTAGVPTTAASQIMADNVPEEDAEAVARLKAAGAVLLGKLNLHEWAFGATGANAFRGPARNPWDRERITGGSSSGSGAAVAAGECLASIGTDTGGSIRIPASLCGVTGLKPTYGRVSRRGVLPLSWSLDHVGPITRSAEDAALVLQAIAGHDPRDASSSIEPVPDYSTALRRGVNGLSIGVPRAFFFDGLEPGIAEAVRTAVRVLESLGAQVQEIALPLIEDTTAAVAAIQLPEALAYHRKWLAERPQDYGDSVRHRLEMGTTYLAAHYIEAQRFRELIVDRWREEVFSQVELLAMPSTAITAPLLDAGTLDTIQRLIRLTNPLNLLGIPVISVPCGFSEAGLPIGLQLAGAWFDEATVLRAAHAYQQTTDWHNQRPPL